MRIYIEDKKPVHQGAGIKIKLLLENDLGERASADITIAFDDYDALGSNVKTGEITEEFFCVLEECGRRYAAYSYGVYLLGFGECNRKKLVTKLVSKGHDRESAEYAADKLAREGCIDEFDLIHTAMLYASNEKCYGRRRIIAELYQKGYERESIVRAFELFEGELDYEETKKRLLLRKFGSECPDTTDIKQKKKIMETLYRYGY